MDLNKIQILGWALLGWFIFIVDQWDTAVKKHEENFLWSRFIKRNLPSFIMNFLCMIALTGLAMGSNLDLSVAESIGAGYIGSQTFKNRFKKNGKV